MEERGGDLLHQRDVDVWKMTRNSTFMGRNSTPSTFLICGGSSGSIESNRSRLNQSIETEIESIDVGFGFIDFDCVWGVVGCWTANRSVADKCVAEELGVGGSIIRRFQNLVLLLFLLVLMFPAYMGCGRRKILI